jgi:protein SCO1/2
MSAQMRRIQNSIRGRPEVRFVSFTVDPERDTPEVLAAYARRFQAQPGRWYFLTGPEATLNMLSRDAFKLSAIAGGSQPDHSTRFVLVDRQARIRGYYTTSEEQNDIKKLLADIERLCEGPS